MANPFLVGANPYTAPAAAVQQEPTAYVKVTLKQKNEIARPVDQTTGAVFSREVYTDIFKLQKGWYAQLEAQYGVNCPNNAEGTDVTEDEDKEAIKVKVNNYWINNKTVFRAHFGTDADARSKVFVLNMVSGDMQSFRAPATTTTTTNTPAPKTKHAHSSHKHSSAHKNKAKDTSSSESSSKDAGVWATGKKDASKKDASSSSDASNSSSDASKSSSASSSSEDVFANASSKKVSSTKKTSSKAPATAGPQTLPFSVTFEHAGKTSVVKRTMAKHFNEMVHVNGQSYLLELVSLKKDATTGKRTDMNQVQNSNGETFLSVVQPIVTDLVDKAFLRKNKNLDGASFKLTMEEVKAPKTGNPFAPKTKTVWELVPLKKAEPKKVESGSESNSKSDADSRSNSDRSSSTSSKSESGNDHSSSSGW